MSTALKKVAITGAAGNLGKVVFDKLVGSGKFDVRVLRRFGSTSTFPAGTEVVDVDFDSVDSLTSALGGQDALVSAVGYTGFLSQLALINAAAAAGVKRIIPSAFGADLDNPKACQLPVFGDKVKAVEHLREKSRTTDLTYTMVYNNEFLDWGLEHNFIVPGLSVAKPLIIDGGDVPFSVTTLGSVADGVIGVLTHPEETKNRSVRIHDIVTSQNQLLALAKKAMPDKSWEVVHARLDDLTTAADARMAKGIFDLETFAPYLYRASLDPSCGGKFDTIDNDLLGVKGVSEDEVTQILKKIVK